MIPGSPSSMERTITSLSLKLHHLMEELKADKPDYTKWLQFIFDVSKVDRPLQLNNDTKTLLTETIDSLFESILIKKLANVNLNYTTLYAAISVFTNYYIYDVYPDIMKFWPIMFVCIPQISRL